jgi:hypothetical protein
LNNIRLYLEKTGSRKTMAKAQVDMLAQIRESRKLKNISKTTIAREAERGIL